MWPLSSLEQSGFVSSIMAVRVISKETIKSKEVARCRGKMIERGRGILETSSHAST